MDSGVARVERYLTHLAAVTGGAEATFNIGDSVTPGLPPVAAITYHDVPEPGLALGVTYGLSLATHPSWRNGTAELTICMRADGADWTASIATIAEFGRGDCEFSYGQLLNVGQPLVDGTAMDGFVVFAPLAIDSEQARVDVGDDQPIFLKGLYPTYASERDFIAERGLEAFWQLDWDACDGARPPVV